MKLTNITMFTRFSMKWVFVALIAVMTTATFVFAVLPQLMDIPSVSNISLQALTASGACCGEGEGANDGGDPGNQIQSWSCTLSASPSRITEGESATLTYSVQNMHPTRGEISNGAGGTSGNSGSVSVTPSETTTYKATFYKEGDGSVETISCSEKVTVEKPKHDAPTCTLSANPDSIEKGNQTELRWTTQHADTITIDQEVGSVNTNGSKHISPTHTKTYTLTASGPGGSTTCTEEVTVTEPPHTGDPKPTCTLGSTPDELPAGGGNTTLIWTTTHADTVSIDRGVGTVSENGEKDIFVDTEGTYTLTATGPGGTAICEAWINVGNTPSGECRLTIDKSVNKTNANVGDIIEYTINFKNTGTGDCTGGGVKLEDVVDRSLKYKSEIHSANVSAGYGSHGVYKASTRTLTWNAHTLNPGESGYVKWKGTVMGEETCDAFDIYNKARITAKELNNFNTWVESNTVKTTVADTCVPKPVCELTASPNSIEKGESATLAWTTQHADTVTLNQGIGDVDEDGSRDVSPSETKTYSLTATGAGGTVICSEEITVTMPPAAPECTLTVDPTSILKGGSATLTWTTKNADSIAIDNNIGNVTANGSQSVSPDVTTLYKLAAVGPGGSVLCKATLSVNEPPKAPVCDLSADKATINEGESFTLTWTSENGNTATLNGADTSLNGSDVFSPTTNTTYTFIVVGDGGTKSCTEDITVIPHQPEDPVCTLDFDKTTITNGESATLTWTTANADSVSIDQGIGSVNLNDNRVLSPTADTTYVLTAIGTNGKTITCDTSIVVEDPQSNQPICDAFTVDRTPVNPGDQIVLSWQTTNATDVSIDNGIGSVSVDGDTTYTLNENRTFTLTATNADGSTSCTVDAQVQTGGGGGGGSSSPRCELTASKTDIQPGEEVTLTWDNIRTNDIILKDNRGNILIDTDKDMDIDEDEGSVVVTPSRSTSYTLVAIRGSRDRECTVDINIDDVTLSSTRTQDPLVAGISLSQVPYTGFEAGPMLTALFYTMLVVWSLGIAYVLVIREDSLLHKRGVVAEATGEQNAYTKPEPVVASTIAMEMPVLEPASSQATPPSNLPTASFTEPVVGYQAALDARAEEVSSHSVSEYETEDEMTALENRAHENRVLLSSDALRFVIDHGTNTEDRLAFLNRIIESAKGTYPSENGWVTINKERITSLFA